MVENKENYLKYMNHKKGSMQEAFQDTSQSGTGNEALTMFRHELLSPFLTVTPSSSSVVKINYGLSLNSLKYGQLLNNINFLNMHSFKCVECNQSII